MKYTYRIFLIVMLAITVGSCERDDLEVGTPIDLGGETWNKTQVDQWLLDSLTLPYNIRVLYRWLPGELNHLQQNLTPPDESKIIPAMSAIKRVWIEPYNAETGSDLFIKKYSPKQFILIGSVEYTAGGVLLGQAEGGNSIAFFDINQNFDKNPITSIERMIQTSHHEFAHILHQNILFPPEFRGISSNLGLDGYTGTWYNVSEQEAHENGYISAYSMAKAEEDFVEMIANMVMLGRSRYEELVASVNATAQQALRSKEQFVVTYMKEVWNIDFYSLQTRVQAALNAQVPTPAPQTLFGFDKIYTTASVDPSNQTLLPQRPAFMNMFNAAADSVALLAPNLTLDSMAVISETADSTSITFYFGQNGNRFSANYLHGVTVNGNVYSFTYGSEDANGEFLHSSVQPILDYFANNQFNLTWQVNPTTTIYPRVRFAPVGSPNNYFVALLLP